MFFGQFIIDYVNILAEIFLIVFSYQTTQIFGDCPQPAQSSISFYCNLFLRVGLKPEVFPFICHSDLLLIFNIYDYMNKIKPISKIILIFYKYAIF